MAEDVAAAEPQALRCAAHPKMETYLRCGRCGTPICPKCLIQTPVGARCRACARLRRLPMYDLSPRFLLRGGLAGLAAACVGGVLVLFAMGAFRFFGFFGMLIFGALYGAAVAGAVSAATNRKRGPWLAGLSIAALVLGFSLARAALVFLQLGARAEPAPLLRALFVGFSPDLGLLLLLAVAGLMAYSRLR